MSKNLTWQEIQDQKLAKAWFNKTGRVLKLRKRRKTNSERAQEAEAAYVAKLSKKLAG